MTKAWSAFDSSKGARTIAEIEILRKKPKSQRLGCSQSPLFNFIPIDHVIDMLHLFLRVADLLINLLIQDLRREDGILKATETDSITQPGIAAYETFLNTVCKINFKWYTNRDTRQLQWRDLTGPEKVKLLISQSISQCSRIQLLFKTSGRSSGAYIVMSKLMTQPLNSKKI